MQRHLVERIVIMRIASLVPTLVLAAFASAQGSTCFSGPALGTFLGNAADTIYPAQPIGFAFPFGGTTYSDVHVSDHGIVFLSNGGVPTPPAVTPFVYTPSLTNFALGGPKIAAMWSDTVGGSTTPGAGVYVNSSATECRIEWRSVYSYGIPTPEFNLAMTLYVNGQVQFDYGAGVTNNSTFGGVSDNGVVGMFASGALPASIDLSIPGASANNNTFENFVVANAFDMASNRLLMVPSNPGWTYVLLGPSGNCASVGNYGTGCGGGLASFYEHFTTTPSIDLSNRAFRMFYNGSGYGVLPNVGTFVPPSSTALNLGLGDDTEAVVTLPSPLTYPGGTTTSLTVGSNGHVAIASNAAAGDFTPTPAEFLGWNNPTWAVWRDFICNATGNVKFEVVAGVACITWDNVIGYQGTTPGVTPSTFQFQFDLATGDVTFVFQSMDTVSVSGYAGGEGWVVGYSGPGASLDPGSMDLSALTTLYAIPGVDFPPIAITNSGLPTIGNAGFAYTISNVQPLLPLAIVFFGSVPVNPGLNLTAIGMPGCSSYTSADLGSLTTPVVAGTGTLAFPIPANAALAGASLSSQAVGFSLSTPLNLVSSNGTTITVGF